MKTPAESEVTNMAQKKVQVQMRMRAKNKCSMRYVAWGQAAEEVCTVFCLQDAAFNELGKPYAIMVTIEETGLPVEVGS